MTTRFFLTLSITFFSITAFSQAVDPGDDQEAPVGEVAPENQTDSTKVYPFAEVSAEYPGGMEALYRDMSNELVYPKKARKAEIQGTVFVQFVIERDGSMSNIKVVRGVDPETLDKEAIRVISKLKPWKPAMQNGKTVRVQYNLPFKFVLTD
jgi:periplasmic protein TonB